MNDEERQRLLDAILDPAPQTMVTRRVVSRSGTSHEHRLPAAAARRLPGGQHRTSCTPGGSSVRASVCRVEDQVVHRDDLVLL